jgi:hypothetical protein
VHAFTHHPRHGLRNMRGPTVGKGARRLCLISSRSMAPLSTLRILVGNFAHASPPLFFAARGTPAFVLPPHRGERSAGRRRVLARHPCAPTWRAERLRGVPRPLRSGRPPLGAPLAASFQSRAALSTRPRPRDQPAPGVVSAASNFNGLHLQTCVTGLSEAKGLFRRLTNLGAEMA